MGNLFCIIVEASLYLAPLDKCKVFFRKFERATADGMFINFLNRLTRDVKAYSA